MTRPALLAALLAALAFPARAQAPDCVVLLHGLARSDASLLVMAEALSSAGYRIVYGDYASTSDTVERLAEAAIGPAIARCGLAPRIDFVTHSMGGILLRQWRARHDLPRMGRTVMLAPPNEGSEIVDALDGVAAFGWMNGPAGMQLGTDGLPGRLPPVWPGVGVIAGTRSLNPVFSTLLPGADDGKVSVAATRVAGMADHIALSVTHTFMMNQPIVIGEVLTFLATGRFDPEMTFGEAVSRLVQGETADGGTGDGQVRDP